MASHYHNKQAVRWLVTAKCSMSLSVYFMQLSLTHCERELYSLRVMYIYAVSSTVPVYRACSSRQISSRPPQLKSFQAEDLKHFFLPKFFTLCIIYFEKFDSINVLLRNAYTPCSNFYFPKIMLHNFFIIIYPKKIISLFKGI